MVKKMSRFETLGILSDTLEDWEGEKNIRGIYFSEKYSYTVNKVHIVRMEHSDDVLPLFYKEGSDIEELITDTYPYKDMKYKPNKRHLLFQEEKIDLVEVDKILEADTWLKINTEDLTEHLSFFKSLVGNRRERKKLIIEINVSGGEFYYRVFKEKKDVRLIMCEKVSKVKYVKCDMRIKLNFNNYLKVLSILEHAEDKVAIYADDKKCILKGCISKTYTSSAYSIATSLSK